jgi:hypothetical protein
MERLWLRTRSSVASAAVDLAPAAAQRCETAAGMRGGHLRIREMETDQAAVRGGLDRDEHVRPLGLWGIHGLGQTTSKISGAANPRARWRFQRSTSDNPQLKGKKIKTNWEKIKFKSLKCRKNLVHLPPIANTLNPKK